MKFLFLVRNKSVISAKRRWEDCKEFQARNKQQQQQQNSVPQIERAVTQSEEEGHASHGHRGAVGFSPADIIPVLFCVRTHCVCTMIKHFSEHISVAKQHFTMSPWKFMFSSLWDLVMVLTPRIPLCRLQSRQHPVKSPISRALET